MANRRSRFFHGYHGHNCYLPLYIFAGERLLWVPAALEHRRLGRQPGRSRADRHPDPGAMARGANHSAGRFRFLPQCADARQPNPLYSGWPGIRDCVNSLARTRPKRVRYTSKRSRPPACSPEFAEQNRLRARRPDSVPRGTCLAYLKREARLKRLKKAADRIDFSSTRSKPLGVSDIRSGSTARYELCCFTWNMFDSMFHVEPHSL
jgi:hypothetical protein